jgi:glycosyltransferase involved in cell wall biosynthesis
MTRRRILHVITGLGAGGAEHVLLRVASSMRRDRFETLVVALMPEGPLAARLRDAGIEVRALGMAPGRPSPAALWKLVRFVRRFRPDVIQTWLYHADLMGALATRLTTVPALSWNLRASDMDMSRYPAHSRWTLSLCARLSRLPNIVIANSEAGRRHHERLGYRPREWTVIPNGIDPSVFRPDVEARRAIRAEAGIPEGAPVVALVARWDAMKDHETFLRAAAILAAVHPDVHFLLAGEGVTPTSPDWGALATRVAGAARIVALGRRDDVARLLAAADVSTCSSISEGFPNVIIESMACGAPCVVTDVGDAALIVGDTGLVVPPRDPEAMAASWARLVALDATELAALGACARQRVIEHYTLERMVSAYETLYERLV